MWSVDLLRSITKRRHPGVYAKITNPEYSRSGGSKSKKHPYNQLATNDRGQRIYPGLACGTTVEKFFRKYVRSPYVKFFAYHPTPHKSGAPADLEFDAAKLASGVAKMKLLRSGGTPVRLPAIYRKGDSIYRLQ